MKVIRIIYTSITIIGLCVAVSSAAHAKDEASSFFSWGKSSPVKVAQASTKKTNKEKAKNAPTRLPWRVNCASDGVKVRCLTSQKLFLRKTRQLLLSITVRAATDKKSGVMMIQLPHGLDLASGLRLKIDNDKEQTQIIQTCDVRGCYTGLPIKGKLLKKMRSGEAINVTFKNLKKKDIKITIPLKGFNEAFAKLIS